MHKRTKATSISKAVMEKVWTRDKGKCVWCGASYSVIPCCHFVSRAHSGLGIEENILTLCTDFGNGCHSLYDHGGAETRCSMRSYFADYLKSIYPKWDIEKLVYKKYQEEG